MIKAQIVHNGHKNAVLLVSGIIYADIIKPKSVLQLADLKSELRSIRLDDIVFSVQGKLTCILWWEEGTLILPLEGRGKLDFSANEGLQSPLGKGIELTTMGFQEPAQHFMFMLNLTK